MTNSSASRIPHEQITTGLKTKSDKIRALAKAGYLRTEIGNILGIRYQHVRNVLVNSGIEEGMKKSTSAKQAPKSVELSNSKSTHDTSWEFLLKAGFQYIGDWHVKENDTLYLDGNMPRMPGVYALVENDRVVYVGLTLNGLHVRMDQYKRGHKGQRTSARINNLIIQSLAEGKRMKVLVATPESFDWNGLPVNGAAGLEVGLIQLIRPAWNIQGA